MPVSNGHDRVPPEHVVVPRSTFEGRELAQAAAESLFARREGNPLDGPSWLALWPAMALNRLDAAAFGLVRACTADIYGDKAVTELNVRWRLAHPGCGPTPGEKTDVPATGAEPALEAVLRHAWPMWAWDAPQRRFTVDEYRFDTQSGAFWDAVWLRSMPSGAAVDARIPRSRWPHILIKGKMVPIRPSVWLRKAENGLVVDSVLSFPGKPRYLHGMAANGNEIEENLPGAVSLNIHRGGYRPREGIGSAERWLRLGEIVIPEAAVRERILDWMAFRLQYPAGLPPGIVVLAGRQGIGKDAFLEPLFRLVGYRNCAFTDPSSFVASFNPYVRAQLIMIAELRANFIEGGREGFYNQVKKLTATPPYFETLNEKHLRQVAVRKAAGVVATTNEIAEYYMPDDDRRSIIALSDAPRDWPDRQGDPAFFTGYFGGLDFGDTDAIGRLLLERRIDLEAMMKAPPDSQGRRIAVQMTGVGDDALGSALLALGDPDVLIGAELRELARATEDRQLQQLIGDGSSARFKGRIARAGYQLLGRAEGAERWTFGEQRTRTVYIHDRLRRRLNEQADRLHPGDTAGQDRWVRNQLLEAAERYGQQWAARKKAEEEAGRAGVPF